MLESPKHAAPEFIDNRHGNTLAEALALLLDRAERLDDLLNLEQRILAGLTRAALANC